MATIIPSRSQIHKFDTPGEELVYTYLEKLNDDYIVIYNPKIELTGNMDFLIICSNGLLCIEVKDWSKSFITTYSNKDILLSDGRVDENPIITSQNRSFNLVNNLTKLLPCLKNTSGKFKSAYSGVAWYLNMSDTDITSLIGTAGPESLFRGNGTRKIITSDTLSLPCTLESTINSCFQYSCSGLLLKPKEQNYIRDLIFNKSYVKSNLDDTIAYIDSKQYEFATNLTYTQQIIVGAAGTGKTTLCVARALFLSDLHPDAQILVLINSTRNFNKLKPLFDTYSNIILKTHTSFRTLVDDGCNFDMILIDEMQDYNESELSDIKSLLLRPTVNHFIGFFDAAQNTFKIPEFDLSKFGEIFYLDFCYLNGSKIFEKAKNFLVVTTLPNTSSLNTNYYNSTKTLTNFSGECLNKHSIISCASPHRDFDNLNSYIDKLLKEYIDTLTKPPDIYTLNDIAILSIGSKNFHSRIINALTNNKISYTDTPMTITTTPTLTLLPHASSKGMDFKAVIIFASKQVNNYNTSALLSLTRAREVSILLTYEII